MNGVNAERELGNKGIKNMGADITREAKKEYQEKLKEYFEQFEKYDKELS